ncbi:uncharacterized protein METZ01_LOCUS66889 [marine metagenome]|uniref:Uncharacterized protein n=1 Tax=marine metagenome TaxID=408172 RepID=A0A381TD05_9ZZZZ
MVFKNFEQGIPYRLGDFYLIQGVSADLGCRFVCVQK